MTAKIEVVKIQRKSTGVQVRVPNSISHILNDVMYMTCTVDEDNSIHYSPIVAK